MLVNSLYTLLPAIFPLPFIFGGMKEPSTYILCSRLYLGGFLFVEVCQHGTGEVVLWVGVRVEGNFVSEEFNHLFEALTVYGV